MNKLPSDPLAQELLQTIDRESRIVLDREGRWHHEGQQITHDRLNAALHGWIDRDEETGRYILCAGEQWCFIEVEDLPFQVLGIDLSGVGLKRVVTLSLSDSTTEELAYDSLLQRSDNSLCCSVKSGRFQARFSRATAFALGEKVEFDDDAPFLEARGRRWVIAIDE